MSVSSLLEQTSPSIVEPQLCSELKKNLLPSPIKKVRWIFDAECASRHAVVSSNDHSLGSKLSRNGHQSSRYCTASDNANRKPELQGDGAVVALLDDSKSGSYKHVSNSLRLGSQGASFASPLTSRLSRPVTRSEDVGVFC